MTHKQLRAQYTQEFKMEAVRQVRAGQAMSGAGADDKVARVSPEQMGLACIFHTIVDGHFR